VSGKGSITTSVEATTIQGRSVLPRARDGGRDTFLPRSLLRQQHGDGSREGRAPLLGGDIARDPALLPPDVRPLGPAMMNPDGAEAGTRRKRDGADLNRDHMVLEQAERPGPLHRVARRVRPTSPWTCHEFTRRDLGGAAGQGGFVAWRITMDGVTTRSSTPGGGGRAAALGGQCGRLLAKPPGTRFLRSHRRGFPRPRAAPLGARTWSSGLTAWRLRRALRSSSRRRPPCRRRIRRRSREPASTRTSSWLWRFLRDGRHRTEGPRDGRERRALDLCRRSSPRTTLWVKPGK